MGPKILIPLLATISLLFLLLPSFSQTAFARPNLDEIQSPFDFLKQLEGSRKGDKVKGTNELKMYLKRFGYLSSTDPNQENDEYFDDVLESAIRNYQLNFNLNVTGALDSETILAMSKPRCGVPDNNKVGKSMKWSKTSKSSLHAISHYSFFEGRPKWPAGKTQFSYAFAAGTRTDVMDPVAQAFSQWTSVTQFTFTLVQDFEAADLKISFQTGDHGDGLPFDGPKGFLAHAFSPPDGRFHYDASENWVVGSQPDGFDLGTVALHEIGHLLGLQHSTVKEAIMFPNINLGEVKGLNDDDIQGIHDLYGS